MSVRLAVPEISVTTAAPWVGATAMMLAAWIGTEYLPVAGVLFAACLLVPPLGVRPKPGTGVSFGPDGLHTRLAASATRGTAPLWLALGTMTTYFVISDVNPTIPGVIVAIMVAGGIVVTSSAQRLTSVPLLTTNLRAQHYPNLLTTALATTRFGIAIGIVAISMWGALQAAGFALSLVTLVLFLVAGATAAYALRNRDRWRRENFAAIRDVAPDFAVHISGPSGSAYQLTMWIPYLDRAERPYIVIVREARLFEEICEVASVPIVLARTVAELDQLVSLRFGTAFYVNNGIKNGHLVRRTGLHHVQLLHGESDKVSSRNPIAGIYDSLFVAGQAAVDRYLNHGVQIPSTKFRLVGRPQVASIEPAAPRDAAAPPSLLYAPTWNGFFDDADYSSLTIGPEIVDAALAAGARVIFRPHPYSYRSATLQKAVASIEDMLARHRAATGIDHIFGARATTEASTIDCFNWSDVMVSDVSSVPIDYLFSDKPLAVVEMHQGTLDRTPGCATLAVGAYVANPTTDLNQTMRSLFVDDVKSEERRKARTYYLTDLPREGYAEAFVDAVRDTVEAHRLPLDGTDDFDEIASDD